MKFKDWKYARQCVAFAKEKGIAVPDGLMDVELDTDGYHGKKALDTMSLCRWYKAPLLVAVFLDISYCLGFDPKPNTITIRIDASNPNHIEHEGRVYVRAVRCKECGRMPEIIETSDDLINVVCFKSRHSSVFHKHKPTAIKMWNTGNKGE